MTRLIEADALLINLDGMMAVSPTGYIHGDTVADMISDAPTVEAIPIEWIKKHIENDRQSAEKAKTEKNSKLFHYYRTLEICADCLLFDWEDENGKYKEFEGELWQD